MSHYEERLEHDLNAIRQAVLAVGKIIGAATKESVRALLQRNRAMASKVILGDLHVNRTIRDIDRRCHAFVARHLPSAGPLRFVSSVLRLDVGLERIGDYAVTIGREAVQLSQDAPPAIAADIEMMCDQALAMYDQAMLAFEKGDPGIARGAIGTTGQLKTTFDKVFDDLIREGDKGSRPVRDLVALMVVLNRLERVRDQAKNICEEIVFAATGETKRPRKYEVVFVDEHNQRLGPMAAALARKGWSDHAHFTTAGWNPADAFDPAISEFIDSRGLEVPGGKPARLDTSHDRLNEYDVIVVLRASAGEQIPEIPFHTVLLEWEIQGTDPEELFKQLSVEVHDLADCLFGAGVA